MSGHHSEHVGLQKHSVGDLYPLAIVGYGNGDTTTYVIEHLTKGAVLGNRFFKSVYQGAYSPVEIVARRGFNYPIDIWIPGRPHYEGNLLVM